MKITLWTLVTETFTSDEPIRTSVHATEAEALAERDALPEGFWGHVDAHTVDIPAELVHMRDPDSECYHALYVNGERAPMPTVHSVDAGAGYEFSDWASSAAWDKRHASPAVWENELEEFYADPCGSRYIEGMPRSTDWIDHLEDTADNRRWWDENLPDVSSLFD